MQYRDGSITLPTDLPATFRHAICNALSTGISKLPDTPPMPVCPLSAWTSRPRCPLRISELNREQSQEISDTIHRPWHQTQDPEHPGKNLIPKRRFPAPSRSFIRAGPPSTAASSWSSRTTSPTRLANTFSAAGAAPISAPTTPSATLTFIARPSQFLIAQFSSETCPVSAPRPATHSQETPSAGCVRTTPASPTSTSETRPPATLRSPLLPRPGRRHHARHAPRARMPTPCEEKGIPTARNGHLRIWKTLPPLPPTASRNLSGKTQETSSPGSDKSSASVPPTRAQTATEPRSPFVPPAASWPPKRPVPDHPEAARQAVPCAFREHPRHPVSAPEFPATAPP